MGYIIISLIGYLLGCISMSYFISKIKHIDLRNHGSKNLGASNTVALIGWKEGIIVVICDILKAVIAVLIARYCFKAYIYGLYVAGVSSVIGHIFPFYLGFKGGKGTASFVGMMFALHPIAGLIISILILGIMYISDYIVLGTFSAIISAPIIIYMLTHNLIGSLIVLCASIIIFYKHIPNIYKLKDGTEMGLRQANKGEYRQ